MAARVLLFSSQWLIQNVFAGTLIMKFCEGYGCADECKYETGTVIFDGECRWYDAAFAEVTCTNDAKLEYKQYSSPNGCEGEPMIFHSGVCYGYTTAEQSYQFFCHNLLDNEQNENSASDSHLFSIGIMLMIMLFVFIWGTFSGYLIYNQRSLKGQNEQQMIL